MRNPEFSPEPAGSENVSRGRAALSSRHAASLERIPRHAGLRARRSDLRGCRRAGELRGRLRRRRLAARRAGSAHRHACASRPLSRRPSHARLGPLGARRSGPARVGRRGGDAARAHLSRRRLDGRLLDSRRRPRRPCGRAGAHADPNLRRDGRSPRPARPARRCDRARESVDRGWTAAPLLAALRLLHRRLRPWRRRPGRCRASAHNTLMSSRRRGTRASRAPSTARSTRCSAHARPAGSTWSSAARSRRNASRPPSSS